MSFEGNSKQWLLKLNTKMQFCNAKISCCNTRNMEFLYIADYKYKSVTNKILSS